MKFLKKMEAAVATVHVALDWQRINWMPTDSWSKKTLLELELLGIKSVDLERAVYVIRLNGEFCIDYPYGTSPTVYVGEGNFRQRILKHKEWIEELKHLVGDFSFQVCIAVPRVKKSFYAYKDAEALILEKFGTQYGSAPLWNKQFETRCCPHYEYSEKSINDVIGKRSGSRYEWALRPMNSSPFYYYFNKTHLN
jgi:hypothetical protein